MLLTDATLTLREFVMHEKVPLASVFREVFAYLAGRRDIAVFGAHAVNAYCGGERMTEDVDILSTHADVVAEEIRELLASRFHIAVRVRSVADGNGLRVYQIQKPKPRHLVDIRKVRTLPATRVMSRVNVILPGELVAMKAISVAAREKRVKGLTDRADLHRLIDRFPEFGHTGSAARRSRHTSRR